MNKLLNFLKIKVINNLILNIVYIAICGAIFISSIALFASFFANQNKVYNTINKYYIDNNLIGKENEFYKDGKYKAAYYLKGGSDFEGIGIYFYHNDIESEGIEITFYDNVSAWYFTDGHTVCNLHFNKYGTLISAERSEYSDKYYSDELISTAFDVAKTSIDMINVDFNNKIRAGITLSKLIEEQLNVQGVAFIVWASIFFVSDILLLSVYFLARKQ